MNIITDIGELNELNIIDYINNMDSLSDINSPNTKLEFKLFSIENIILFILLVACIFLIYNNYQKPVTKKTILVTIYLYIFVAIFFIAICSQYIASLSIINTKNYWKFIILYLLITFASIFLIFKDNFYLNHIGFLLLLLALSLIIGISLRSSKNIISGTILTSIFIIILTTIVFLSSNEALFKMSKWFTLLNSVLFGIIIIQIGVLLFFHTDQLFYKIFSVVIVILFSFYILSDTARLYLEANQNKCLTHKCINYPKKSANLILDYANIFAIFLRTGR